MRNLPMPLIAWLSLALVIAGPLGRAETETDKRLRQKSELRLEMANLRLKLLTEDAELRELNKRIQGLQKNLARRLDAQPGMIELRKKMLFLEAALRKDRAEAAADQPGQP